MNIETNVLIYHLTDKNHDELFEKRGLFNQEGASLKNRGNILKFEGKRLIVESRDKDYEFISIRHNADYRTIQKNNGLVLNNASVILSEAYSFVK